jgi:hypothetical protein
MGREARTAMQVYKFLPANCALDDLLKRRLKISTFGDMNDPFELYGVRFSNPDVQSLLASHSQLNHGVLCFSRNWSNPMLWSHYADKHKGICLGFQISASDRVYEPRYVESRCELDSEAMLEAAAPGDYLKESDPRFKAAKEITQKMLMTKYNGWKYEDEVRIFIALKEEQKDDNSYFAGFDENIQPNMLITGPRCTIVMKDVKTAVGGYAPPVKLIRAILSPDSFKVVESR